MAASSLENLRMRPMLGWLLVLSSALVMAGCSAKYMKVKNPDLLTSGNREFEQAVKIDAPTEDGPTVTTSGPPPEPAETAAKGKKGKGAKKAPPPRKAPAKKGKAGAKAEGPLVHEPADVEDGRGFIGRRPVKDPFRIGETVVHDVSYFKVSAGALTMKVEPFAQVNGRKAYNFTTSLKTYPRFESLVYAVDDKAVTLVDFDQLIPRVFTLHVKETGQLKEARSYFDFDKLQARYWEKKVNKQGEVEEKKQEWEILPYSQNVFSAIYYMRLFDWEMGREYAFRVADDEQNLIFKGKAIRRETLDTDLGPFKAIVVKPEITVKGIFKPVGDIYIWLSDDDRKLVLRLESKIKIGTLVSEIIRYEPGRAP
ncbi:MAG: DUF3108 domain-containing protein [Bdellovibrionaceae bacterium]|nr:DUF3108 domain-containing protein [Pseudobdellovibrionaceae bacterium]